MCGRSRAARCIRAPPLPSCVTLGPVTCPLWDSVSGHGKSIGSRGNSECKGPEAGTSLVPSRPGQEVLMAGAEVAPGRPAGVGSQGGFRAGEPQAPLLISRSCLWLWGGEGAVGGHGDGRQWRWPGLGGRGGAGKRWGRTGFCGVYKGRPACILQTRKPGRPSPRGGAPSCIGGRSLP